MKTFHDSTGRAWTVALNVGVLKRVRSLCDVDLMAAVEGKLVERLVSDPRGGTSCYRGTMHRRVFLLRISRVRSSCLWRKR